MWKPDANNSSRLTTALAFGPLAIVPAMLLAISALRILYPEAQAELLRQYHAGLVISFFGLLLSYGFTLLYGLPVYWLLNRIGICNVFTVLIASIIPALLLTFINHVQWPYYLAMAYFSAFVALTCWLIILKE